jgi:hypothetical protein
VDTRRLLAAAAAAVALIAVGTAIAIVRDGGGTAGEAAPSGRSTQAAAATPSSRANPESPALPTVDTVRPTEPLDSAAPSPPATTAGSLRAGNLPVAALIGQQWQPYADPGGSEAGFTGNGSWVRARDPRDVVDGLVPIGCLGLDSPPRVPRPAAALEGTYVTGEGDGRGVALALEYRSDSEAAAFMTAQSAIVRSCAAPRGGVGPDDPLTLVITPRTVKPDLVVDERQEFGVDASDLTWTEVIVRSGRRVALLTVGTAAGARAPDPAELATALRASVAQR